MKNLLLILFLLPSLVFGQTEVVGYDRYQKDYAALKTQIASMQKSIDSLKGKVTLPPPNVDTLGTCKRGPTILAITNISNTGADVRFDGEDVFKLAWSVGTLGAELTPTSSTFHINYSLPNGSYTLKLDGKSCIGTSQKAFSIGSTPPTPPDPPKPTVGKRDIYMNTTGYGFDVNDPDGIYKDWKPRIEQLVNLNHNGQKFSGITGILLHVLWYDYEYKEGEYRDDVMLKVLNYCKARGLKLSISFAPWRAYGDGYLQDTEIEKTPNGNIWFANGDLPETYRKIIPSMYSTTARAKLYACVKHLAQFLHSHPDYGDYMSLSSAPTEEFQTVRNEQTGFAVGYGMATLRAWDTYSNGAYPPYPANGTVDAYYALSLTDIGNKWYEFMTDGLSQFQANFNNAVRDGGLRCGAGYAGVGVYTAFRDNTFHLNRIFAGSDIVYSSEGDAQSNWRKLMATDFNKGTFPGSGLAAEFDPTDLNCAQQFPIMDKDITCVDNNLFVQYGSSLFKRGLEDMHLAMAWREDLTVQLTEGFWYFKENFIDSDKGMTGIVIGQPIEYTQKTAAQGQTYTDQWSKNGGSLNKQVLINLK